MRFMNKVVRKHSYVMSVEDHIKHQVSLPPHLLSKRTVQSLLAACWEAHAKHGDGSMIGRTQVGEKLAILSEELGEISEAMIRGNWEGVESELYQFAASAALWAQALAGTDELYEQGDWMMDQKPLDPASGRHGRRTGDRKAT